MADFREKISEFLESPSTEDLRGIIEFVDNYFPASVDKRKILRRLRRLYFVDSRIGIKEKIDMFIANH